MFKPLQGAPDTYRTPPEEFGSRGITLPNRSLVNPMFLDMNEVRSPLRINRVDLCISDNGTRHHTDKFNAMKSKDNPHLIIRRGQVFYLKLLLDRDYQPQVDGVSFVFLPAGSQNDKLDVTKKNDIVVPVLESVSSDEKHFKWYACIVDSEEKEMRIKVHPAPSCLVGEWKMEVDTKLQIEFDGETYPIETPIIILFNPWCANDQVYMEDGDKRQEYVLNETGLVFRGSYNNVQPTPWFFGQFEKDILQCAIMLYTEVHEVATPYRYNPIDICRSLSASMNSVDGKGVLVGKWDGQYEVEHTRPEAWAGSVKILTKYYKTRQPVKYGQCWVFAGVCTTVCRALGIPCRPVTVYNCAYDADCNLLVDQYLEESSKWMPTANCSWHHRVWNEVWIARWDLQKSNHPLQKHVTYDGWNVIDDCTHKIWSISHCEGPVSVKTIRNGNLELAYNTRNAYAKVNANILYWKNIEDNKQLKMVGNDINWVGRKIVTKAIGYYKHKDITLNYKYPEDWAEKHDMKMVLSYTENHINRLYLNTNFNKIKYEIKLPEEPPMVGSPIELFMIIHNYSIEMYEVEVNIVLHLENYAGTDKIPIKEEQLKVQIRPKEVKYHTLRVTYDDYKDCNLKEEDNFWIGCHAFIKQKDFDYFDQDVLKMRKPKLSFMVNTSHHPTSSAQQVSLYEDDNNKQYINQEEHFKVEQEHTSKRIKELLRTSTQDLGFLRQCMGPFNVNVDQEFQIQASFTNPLPVSLTNGCFQFEGPDKVQKLPLHRDILPGGLAVGKCQWRVMTPGKYEICGTYVSNELKEVNGLCHINVT